MAASPEQPGKQKVVSKRPAVRASKQAPGQLSARDVSRISKEQGKMSEAFSSKASAEAKSTFDEMSEQARTAVEKGSKMFEEMNDIFRSNSDAFAAAGRAATKGAETLGQNAAEFSRKSFDDARSAFKALSGVKSPNEFFTVQNNYMRAQFDAMVGEASKLSNTMVKIFGDVSEPLTSQAARTADKFKQTLKI